MIFWFHFLNTSYITNNKTHKIITIGGRGKSLSMKSDTNSGKDYKLSLFLLYPDFHLQSFLASMDLEYLKAGQFFLKVSVLRGNTKVNP